MSNHTSQQQPTQSGADGATVQHEQVNLDAFNERLAIEYDDLFRNDPEYAYSASRNTPSELARKMTLALDRGSGNKDGKGVARTCKHFGIPHTYRAIRAFLGREKGAR